MPKNTNQHVDRLARFLPFDPSHDQIYEEYQLPGDSINLDTIAFGYVKRAVTSGARIVVLTGDAGHGKTHLCRKLIEQLLGYPESEARQLINSRCDGNSTLAEKENSSCKTSRPLRIVKDFSEFSTAVANELFNSLQVDEATTTIICANEGRLRAVLSGGKAGEIGGKILKAFEGSFLDGKTSLDGQIHIVNLNYQSVAANTPNTSLIDRAIREWTSGTRWKSCTDCTAQSNCPINRNRELLSERVGQELAQTRKEKLRLLLATLERIGYVITIRDMLMSLAYLLTGGLKCNDVHNWNQKAKGPWQAAYAFYNLAFEPPSTISKEQLRRLPLMQQLPKLDPGRRAIREVDERVLNRQDVFEPNQSDLKFQIENDSGIESIDAADGIDGIIGDPRNKKQRTIEATKVKHVVRALRRRAFVDGLVGEDNDMANLGFPYGSQFMDTLSGRLQKSGQVLLKRSIVAGLHHIQGIRFFETTPTLHLVDPAFGTSMTGTAIIASRVKPADIQLIRLGDKWGQTTDHANHISASVDWIDRHIVLRINDQQNRSHDLLLDLVLFDCILRAASGHVPTKFYEHDIRRVRRFLGQIAQVTKSSSDYISLIREGKSYSISIDGSTIQVGAGA